MWRGRSPFDGLAVRIVSFCGIHADACYVRPCVLPRLNGVSWPDESGRLDEQDDAGRGAAAAEDYPRSGHSDYCVYAFPVAGLIRTPQLKPGGLAATPERTNWSLTSHSRVVHVLGRLPSV